MPGDAYTVTAPNYNIDTANKKGGKARRTGKEKA